MGAGRPVLDNAAALPRKYDIALLETSPSTMKTGLCRPVAERGRCSVAPHVTLLTRRMWFQGSCSNTHPNPLQTPLGVCVPVYKNLSARRPTAGRGGRIRETTTTVTMRFVMWMPQPSNTPVSTMDLPSASITSGQTALPSWWYTLFSALQTSSTTKLSGNPMIRAHSRGV